MGVETLDLGFPKLGLDFACIRFETLDLKLSADLHELDSDSRLLLDLGIASWLFLFFFSLTAFLLLPETTGKWFR